MSEMDKDLYVGFTKDLKKRFDEHQKGLVASTIHRRPLKIVYYEACLNKNDALNREKYFKTGFGRKFLRNRLRNHFDREYE
jgi:putative endonuclease